MINLFFQFVNGVHYLCIYTPPLIEIQIFQHEATGRHGSREK